MNILKFFKRERRDTSYTDTIVNEIIDRSYAQQPTSRYATAALESAAGVVGRAFASAMVQASGVAGDPLTPSLLQLIGRSLIRRGEFLGLIEVNGSGLQIIPASTATVTGGVDPSSWNYLLTIAAPTETETKQVSADSVVHVRYAFNPERPWRGLGPIDIATLAGELSAETARALTDESSGPRGSLLPIPGVDGADQSISDLRADLRKLKGSVALVESQNTILPNAQQSSAGWDVRRLGANPPSSLVSLQSQAYNEVLSACGINPSLLSLTDGTSMRESWRQFLFGVIAPLGRLCTEELTLKLDTDIKLEWSELRASDIQGRARAFGSLVSAGLDIERAADVAGLNN